MPDKLLSLGWRDKPAMREGVKVLLRQAAAVEREAWLDAAMNAPRLPGWILPSDCLEQPTRPICNLKSVI
ncbi:MAG TPA: hypothetical protein VI136_25585 [Verrucomicrobiae bacterium]